MNPNSAVLSEIGKDTYHNIFTRSTLQNWSQSASLCNISHNIAIL